MKTKKLLKLLKKFLKIVLFES